MPRPSNKEERRAQIADGLLTVMARDGYERATIAAIAREAGLGSGLVHYHFESKEDILLAVITELRARVQRRYEARAARCGDDPLDRLLAYVDAHVALGDDADPRAVAAWVAIGAEAIGQPAVRELYAEAVHESMAELDKLVRACLRQADRSTRDARHIAAAILSAIEGAYQLAATAPDELPRGFAAPTLRKMIKGLLGD
jgi:TetR/AcrR family transcriptional repressor of bet genes